MMNYSGNFVQCAVITRQFVGHSIASLGGERWFPINLARSSVALAINDALKKFGQRAEAPARNRMDRH